MHRAGEATPDPVRLGRLPEYTPRPQRLIAEDIATRIGLLLSEGIRRALMYAASEPVNAGIVRLKGSASYHLRQLAEEGVIRFLCEAPPLGKGNGTKLFVPPGWTPVCGEHELQRLIDVARTDVGARQAVADLVWIPDSDGVPVPGAQAGVVAVEAEDVVAGVSFDPPMEAPDETGMADAVAGGGGLRGMPASAGGAGAGAAVERVGAVVGHRVDPTVVPGGKPTPGEYAEPPMDDPAVPCLDELRCRYRMRLASGPWTCAHCHPPVPPMRWPAEGWAMLDDDGRVDALVVAFSATEEQA
jgi:hypothetical protein